jgi:hypothetical protein
VGEVSVTKADLDAVIASLNPQAQKSLATQGRRSLGDQYATMVILSQGAVSHHYDTTPAFQRMLAFARLQILAQGQIQSIMQNSAVTPEEANKYYASHQSEFDQAQLRQVVIRKKAEGAKEGTPGLAPEEAKTRAEEIRKALGSGQDAKKVADQFQVPNVIRIDVEPTAVRQGTIRADMDKAAFELHDGQVSDVFDVGQSLIFFQLVSRKPMEFKDVSSQIEKTLQQQRVDDTIAALKKNAKIWMDDNYFGAPTQLAPQGALGPSVPSSQAKPSK